MVLPVRFKQLSDFAGTWLKWFGYWALFDLAIHIAGPHLGWAFWDKPRTPEEMLIFDSWMASWFMLIYGIRSGRPSAFLRSKWLRLKKNRDSQAT